MGGKGGHEREVRLCKFLCDDWTALGADQPEWHSLPGGRHRVESLTSDVCALGPGFVLRITLAHMSAHSWRSDPNQDVSQLQKCRTYLQFSSVLLQFPCGLAKLFLLWLLNPPHPLFSSSSCHLQRADGKRQLMPLVGIE